MIPDDATNHQLPSGIVADFFGEVNVKRQGKVMEVSFTVLKVPDGDDAEGYQTGVALDGSSSMKNAYGYAMQGDIPPEAVAEYKQKGWINRKFVDGKQRTSLAAVAQADAIERGFLTRCPNLLEPIARELVEFLADGLDDDGGTTVIYWSCGDDGGDIQVLGDVTGEECATLSIEGPRGGKSFGNGTQLKPAMKYFAERFDDAANGIYVFITDGSLDDFEEVKQYTTELAKEIYAGDRNPLKFVLIGLGEDINRQQLEELDDLDPGVPIDVWDHKIATEMRQLEEIFAEVVNENEILFPPSTIHDSTGAVVKNLSGGVPAKVDFEISADSEYFELRCEGASIRQGLELG